ncbi:hypothetical protein D3H55_23160 [Bacillus salacetis]|uniref:Uncharacterized protein n=1 Tax=Bacillus salacetis TaxID=2315464 RepID=A0A3A1QS49_9BACI|nr:hypothetical protein [Bacillus salacetis]RIW27282.1 hypothetical protein D3H55_23160 [Bacillus salacetis]
MKKNLVSITASVLLFSYLAPSSISFAQENSVSEIEMIEEYVPSEEEIAQLDKILSAIEEIDQNLDMENLSNNKTEDVSSLSVEAQDFYGLYKTELEKDNNVSQLDAIGVIKDSYNNQVVSPDRVSSLGYSVGSVKEYKLSNSDVRTIIGIIGVHGTGWAFLKELVKKFSGKGPTLLTILIIGVPAIGGAALAVCNRKGKGVVITDIRIGASHSFSCRSR